MKLWKKNQMANHVVVNQTSAKTQQITKILSTMLSVVV